MAVEDVDLTLDQVKRRVKRAGGSLLLTRKGKPVLLVHDLSGHDAESLGLSTNLSLARFVNKRRAEAHKRGSVNFDEVCKKYGLKPVNRQ